MCFMKKLFDGKIYLEGLRQTKVMGLFLLIATVVGNALFPLNEFVEYLSYFHGDQTAYLVDLGTFTPFLIVFLFLAPIMLSMHLFSFLNKRNGSDFYHALPCTRTCLLVSFSMSIVTWLASTILLTALVNAFLYTICPSTYINWAFIPYNFFTYFCGSLLVLSVMLIAKSMTGTGISNIVVAALIGFGPRALAMIFVSVLTDIMPILDVNSMGFFMNTAYNIPVNFVLGMDMVDETSFTFIPGMIATAALALAYFVIAWLLFKRRKSETAQKSAPNKVMQHVIRCLITIPITLIIPISIVQDEYIGFYSIIVILFVAAIIYFGYELLSTRKAKNLLYALPVFAVVILFDILFGAALIGARQMALNVPEVSEIKAVSVSWKQDDYGFYKHYNELLLTEELFVEDEALIQMVNEALNNTVQDIEVGDYYNKLYGSYDKVTYYSYPVSIRKQNGSVMKRNVLFRYDELDEILAAYEQDAAYQEKLVQLPDRKSIQDIFLFNSYYNTIDQAVTEEIWEIFCEEYEALAYEEKLLTNGIGDFYENSDWDDTSLTKLPIQVYGYWGVQSYQVTYSISAKTPKTYQAYMEAINEHSQKDVALLFDELEAFKIGEKYNVEYEINFQDCNDQLYYMDCNLSSTGMSLYNEKSGLYLHETMQDIYSVLEDATSRPVDLKQPLFQLTFHRNEWNPEGGAEYGDGITVYFNLTDAELEVLMPYLGEVYSVDISEW